MKPFYIVDIGGTSIKFGISNISAQEPLFQIQTPQNRTDIINTICEAINDFDTSFQSQNQIDTVMVSCPMCVFGLKGRAALDRLQSIHALPSSHGEGLQLRFPKAKNKNKIANSIKL